MEQIAVFLFLIITVYPISFVTSVESVLDTRRSGSVFEDGDSGKRVLYIFIFYSWFLFSDGNDIGFTEINP